MKMQYRNIKASKANGGKAEVLREVKSHYYGLIGCLDQDWSQSELSENEKPTGPGHDGRRARAPTLGGRAAW